jgi:hypothetical protein
MHSWRMSMICCMHLLRWCGSHEYRNIQVRIELTGDINWPRQLATIPDGWAGARTLHVACMNTEVYIRNTPAHPPAALCYPQGCCAAPCVRYPFNSKAQ